MRQETFTGWAKFASGSKVKVHSRHWLELVEPGTIVDFRPDRQNHWLVRFDSGYPGGAIDGDKLSLWGDNLETNLKTNDPPMRSGVRLFGISPHTHRAKIYWTTEQ